MSLPDEGLFSNKATVTLPTLAAPTPCTILPWATTKGTNDLWIAGESVFNGGTRRFSGATGDVDGFYGEGERKNQILRVNFDTQTGFAAEWSPYSGTSYTRLWVRLALDMSGYALTIETVPSGPSRVGYTNLKLDRYDSGVSHELWSKSNFHWHGVLNEGEPETIRVPGGEIALIANYGIISVWFLIVTFPESGPSKEEWVELGKVSDSKYKGGYFGLEGQGESLTTVNEGESENVGRFAPSDEVRCWELPYEAPETLDMAMML